MPTTLLHIPTVKPYQVLQEMSVVTVAVQAHLRNVAAEIAR
jgi:hypothetical protein